LPTFTPSGLPGTRVGSPPMKHLEGGGTNYMQVLNYKYLAILGVDFFGRNKSRKHKKKVRQKS
jgi:hypothetical protein